MSTFRELFGDCLEKEAPPKQRGRKRTRNSYASSDGSDGNGSDSSDGNGSDRSDESDTDDSGGSGDRRSVDYPSYTQPECGIELHSNYQPLWSTLLGCWVSLLSQVPAAVANCVSRAYTLTQWYGARVWPRCQRNLSRPLLMNCEDTTRSPDNSPSGNCLRTSNAMRALSWKPSNCPQPTRRGVRHRLRHRLAHAVQL